VWWRPYLKIIAVSWKSVNCRPVWRSRFNLYRWNHITNDWRNWFIIRSRKSVKILVVVPCVMMFLILLTFLIYCVLAGIHRNISTQWVNQSFCPGASGCAIVHGNGPKLLRHCQNSIARNLLLATISTSDRTKADLLFELTSYIESACLSRKASDWTVLEPYPRGLRQFNIVQKIVITSCEPIIDFFFHLWNSWSNYLFYVGNVEW